MDGDGDSTVCAKALSKYILTAEHVAKAGTQLPLVFSTSELSAWKAAAIAKRCLAVYVSTRTHRLPSSIMTTTRLGSILKHIIQEAFATDMIKRRFERGCVASFDVVLTGLRLSFSDSIKFASFDALIKNDKALRIGCDVLLIV